ncbi:hypothetical protein [Sulfitobacter sp. S190]|uniref:hypothetical protein n=1 Tax=Sulfitobacter sp. S190 TaxID=2867022 RepID=UPI0021A5A6A7|nr:hypothetical protein [Sulfitobacter sp. S190]UWR23340.1 hypothetical protein K3756_04940 [Sulfitobacter sp. S190]
MRVPFRFMLCAALAAATLASPLSAGEAFLQYQTPPADVDRPAFMPQVTKYPSFRPVQRTPTAREQARAAPPPPTRSPEPDTIILSVGDRVQVVPRARILGD